MACPAYVGAVLTVCMQYVVWVVSVWGNIPLRFHKRRKIVVHAMHIDDDILFN